jgi:hypothetical protein
VISITDHHDVTFIPYVVKANQAAHDFAIVFPGAEVTCNDNAQCLVLFEPSSAPDLWAHFLGKLPGVAQADKNLPKTSPTVNAQISISGLLDAGAAFLDEGCSPVLAGLLGLGGTAGQARGTIPSDVAWTVALKIGLSPNRAGVQAFRERHCRLKVEWST